ncbi:MAG TPA: (d)CMP kinase [Verrucomicrobiae bacterium]|nr:(d)CMP kinase [Verrucomicrobiae bacterium]
MSENVTVVAVDGPAASGKSTVSRSAARMLGYNYVDTGAMYRSITWKAIDEGIDVDDTVSVIAMMHRIKISFELVDKQVRMLIDGKYPGNAIREPAVTDRVSAISAIPEVRQVLVQHQRSLTKFGSLVMEGRDIGTVVFPDTPYKFYLEANTEVRAARRKRDLEAMKIEASEEGVKESIQRRDKKDSGRSVSPLQIALGATIVENSRLTVDETARVIVDHIRQQGTRRGSFSAGGA